MATPTTHGRRRRPRWQRSLALLVVVAVVVLVVRSLLLQAFYIPSPSMEPGLVIEDRILVEKVSYWGGGSPQRGDVVVFEDPDHWLSPDEAAAPTNPLARALDRVGLYPSGGHLVKRVIGVAGDTVVCCDRQGRLSVNGAPLDEDGYLVPHHGCNGPVPKTCDWSAGPVPEGHVFVMGDNRARSADSSAHLCPERAACDPDDPYVDTDLVVGRVFALIWPWSRLAALTRPDSFAEVPDAAGHLGADRPAGAG